MLLKKLDFTINVLAKIFLQNKKNVLENSCYQN